MTRGRAGCCPYLFHIMRAGQAKTIFKQAAAPRSLPEKKRGAFIVRLKRNNGRPPTRHTTALIFKPGTGRAGDAGRYAATFGGVCVAQHSTAAGILIVWGPACIGMK